MNALQIDFSSPSLQRTLHRTGALTWVVAAVALLLCAGAAWTGWRLLEQQRADQATLAAARLRAAVPAPAPVDKLAPRITEVQAGAVNAAILQLNLPWRALHDAIADATPADIAMLALEPDARKRSMKITAEAKSSDAMIGYVEELKKQELFGAVTLTRHEVNEQDPARPIRFQIEAEWMAP